ncbi:MAG: cofactor-independent phosphoglycerate mutase [Candidatus Hadarchaeales archaeon]
MKYVIVVGDGMSDYPVQKIGGKTPLQVAHKPNMDWIAYNGKSGLLRTIPKGTDPGSDIAIMSILGYDPKRFHTGRGPIEAAALGIKLDGGAVAFRCNLITAENGIIKDYSGGHITTKEAKKLLDAISKKYGNIGEFHVGLSYRNIFVLKNALFEAVKIKTTPPHHAVGDKVLDKLASPKKNKIAQLINEMMLDSKNILSNHPVNILRVKKGQNPANMIWLWGQGGRPDMPSMKEKYGLDGSVISAVMVVKGVGALAGLDAPEVPGATGYYDTNYSNKARYALKVLKKRNFVVVHVEAPDEAGHEGDLDEKIRAIENIDSKIVGKILDGIGDEDFKIAVMADHPTPVEVRRHTSDPVPFSVASSTSRGDGLKCYDEESAKKGSLGLMMGPMFIKKMIEI